MADIGTPLPLAKTLSRRLLPVVIGMAVLIGVGFPLGDIVLDLRSVHARAKIAATQIAEKIQTLAFPSPSLWQYQVLRYRYLSDEFKNIPDLLAVRVFDASGHVITEYTYSNPDANAWLASYAPVATAPIIFNNRPMGSVEVTFSLVEIVSITKWIAMISAVIGIGLAYLAHRVPVSIVKRLEHALQRQIDALTHATAESEKQRQFAEAHSRRLDALLRAIHLVMRGLDLRTTLDKILTVAAQIAETPHVKVVLIDQETGRLRMAAIVDTPVVPSPDGHEDDYALSNIVRTTGEPLYVADCQNDPRNSVREWDRARGIVTYLGLPIRVRDAVLGVLSFNTTAPRAYTSSELEYLRSFADAAAIAIENARLFALEQEGRATLEAVRAATVSIVGQLDLRLLFDSVVECSAKLVHSRKAALFVWEEGVQDFRLAASQGTCTGEGEAWDLDGLLRTVKERRAGLVVNNYTVEPPDATVADRPGCRSLLLEPLISHDCLTGVLVAARPHGEPPFTEQHRGTLALFLATAVIALENARLFQEVHEARRRLSMLSERVVEARENESRRIGRELHDEIGQLLTGLHLTLEAAVVKRDGDSDAKLVKAMGVAQELTTRVREMSLDLRPSVLDDLGLVPATVWLLDRYRGQTGIHVMLRHRQVEGRRFPSAVETAAYRIIQEALTNVARHAGVFEAIVRLWADSDELGLQVEDRGGGFDQHHVLATRNSTGLIGMSERAQLLGGRVTIESAQDTGTLITAEFPLQEVTERGLTEP